MTHVLSAILHERDAAVQKLSEAQELLHLARKRADGAEARELQLRREVARLHVLEAVVSRVVDGCRTATGGITGATSYEMADIRSALGLVE